MPFTVFRVGYSDLVLFIWFYFGWVETKPYTLAQTKLESSGFCLSLLEADCKPEHYFIIECKVDTQRGEMSI